jgi:hypothetical protein
MPRSVNPLVLEIRGGLPDGDSTFANAGAMHWEQTPGEQYSAFCARVVAEATEAGERLVLIGGLPVTEPTLPVADSIAAILDNERDYQAS